MDKTKIIAIEGIDGSGKTVQWSNLIDELKALGYSVRGLEFPRYDAYFGKQIGRFLSGKDGVKATDIDNKSMALWFALDRWDAFSSFDMKGIDFLVINRYVWSNAVYQSIREGDTDLVDWVLELEFDRLSLPKPDVTIVLDVVPGCAKANVSKKGLREYIGAKADAYESSEHIQQKAREKYIECAKKHADIAIISCTDDLGKMLPLDVISSAIKDALISRKII